MQRNGSENQRTLETYESTADRYAAASVPAPSGRIRRYLDEFAERLVVGASVLEIGSATGRDAAYLEQLGLRVRRTDGARSFVRLMREAGADAEVVNVLEDDLGGPYDGVWANAVFHHFSSEEFRLALERLAHATETGCVLGFSVKRGDGEEWSSAKVGAPRFFRYWQPDELRPLLTGSGWDLLSLIEDDADEQRWLQVLCVRQASHQIAVG